LVIDCHQSSFDRGSWKFGMMTRRKTGSLLFKNNETGSAKSARHAFKYRIIANYVGGARRTKGTPREIWGFRKKLVAMSSCAAWFVARTKIDSPEPRVVQLLLRTCRNTYDGKSHASHSYFFSIIIFNFLSLLMCELNYNTRKMLSSWFLTKFLLKFDIVNVVNKKHLETFQQYCSNIAVMLLECFKKSFLITE